MSDKYKSVKTKGWYTEDNLNFQAAVLSSQTELEPGMYTPIHTHQGYFLSKEIISDKNYLKFPDSNSATIIKDIQNFWKKENLFRTYKFPYRRGILMYGPQGTGKSCTVALVGNEVIQNGGIMLRFTDTQTFIAGMKAVRSIQPTVPVVALMEDLDYLLLNENQSMFLNLLDGVGEVVDKVVFLATTNDLAALPANIKDRPSRFDRRFFFDLPTAIARKYYLNSLFRENNHNYPIDQWVENTEGFSFAHLKELFISVVLFENPFAEVVKELRAMKEVNDICADCNLNFDECECD